MLFDNKDAYICLYEHMTCEDFGELIECKECQNYTEQLGCVHDAFFEEVYDRVMYISIIYKVLRNI